VWAFTGADIDSASSTPSATHILVVHFLFFICVPLADSLNVHHVAGKSCPTWPVPAVKAFTVPALPVTSSNCCARVAGHSGTTGKIFEEQMVTSVLPVTPDAKIC
ncbi:MAG: hypothetical protein P8Z33_15240, partial [Gammaproteobacteria bacterium]